MGGYHLLYIYYQQTLKSEMKAYLKENQASELGTRLVFSMENGKVQDPNFAWEEENEEFRFQQELYDVVSLKNSHGKLEIICLKDNDENHLETQLNEIHKSNKSNPSKTNLNNCKFFSVFNFQKQNLVELKFAVSKQLNTVYSIDLSYIFYDIQSPPPRFC